MLHIKDIEAFARINEALFRAPGTAGHSGEGGGGDDNADLSNHPAVMLARLMAAAKASAEEELRAEAAQRAAEPEQTAQPAASAPTTEDSQDPAAPSPTMAALFTRMMFGQR